METTGINKTVYRSDVISALDSFTSVRNVLAWEMFQDGQVRNYDGVINDLQRLYPNIDFDSVTENVNPESIAADENAIYALVDSIINKLIESGISKDNFNYAIWACDDPENVADTYGVDIDDVSAYKIIDGILLQDLGYEGQLYGVAEYPEEEWDVIESALKGGNMKTPEDYKDYYLEQLTEQFGDMTEADYNSAKKFCYDEEWNLGEVGNMAEAIDGLGDAWTEYQKQYKEGFEIMNSKNITSWVVEPKPKFDFNTHTPEQAYKLGFENYWNWRSFESTTVRNFTGACKCPYTNPELKKKYYEGWNKAEKMSVTSSKKNIKSSKIDELEMFEEESKYGNRREFEDFKRNHPESTITYLDWRKYLNGYEDDVEYEYEDENGNMYTWDMIKTEIDQWVDSGDFEEQNGELPEYFEKDGTPKYQKIYDDFWDIGSNGVMEYIGSSLEPEWTAYEPHFKNLKPRHEDDPKNGWGAMEEQQKKIIDDNDHKVVVKYGHGGSCTLYGAETGEVISPFSTIKDMQDFKKKNNLTIVKNSRRNNMKKTIKSDIDWESAKHAFDDKKYLIYKTGIDDEWEEFPFYGTDNAFTADEYERKGYKVEKNMIKSSYGRYNVNNDIYAVYVDDDLVEYVANTSIPGYEYISMNEYGDIAYRDSFRPTWFEKFKKKYGTISDVEEQSNVRMYGQKVLDAIEKSLKYDEYEKDMNENGTAYEFKGSDGKWYPIDPGTSSMAMCRTSNIPVRPVTSSRKPINSGYTGTNVTVEYGPYGEEKDFPFYDMKGETVEQIDEAIGYYDEVKTAWGSDGESYMILQDRANSEDKIAVLEDDYNEWVENMNNEDYSKIIGSSKKGEKKMKIQSKRLIKSGTSNFGSNDDVFGYSFPLVTYIAENYMYDEETDSETEERDYDADSWEYEDAIDNAKALADEMDIPQYDDYSEPYLCHEPFMIKFRDGYYEGVWIEVKEGTDEEDIYNTNEYGSYYDGGRPFTDEEMNKFADKLNEYFNKLCSEYGWQKLGVTARFSNGETVYHKIDNSRKPIQSANYDGIKKQMQYTLDVLKEDAEDSDEEYAERMGYDGTDAGAVRYAINRFKNEYGIRNRYNVVNQSELADWLAGLPLSFDYANYNILQKGVEWGYLPPIQEGTDLTRKEANWLDNWWNGLANNILKLARKYNVGITSSRKSVISGLTFRQAVQDFKAAGQWNDYYEMQQDWESYKDGLERDGLISEKTRSTWGNPCTPEGFKRWNK